MKSPTSTLNPARSAAIDKKEDQIADPCQPENHVVLRDQIRRSFNHHVSLGSESTLCDKHLQPNWYRFDSPAGNVMPTECPGGKYCGTEKPVWMKGEFALLQKKLI